MEQHRANPQCSSCHRVIDPLGLALENFDVTGRWRMRDNGNLVDPVRDLYDGTKMNGADGLRAALLKHQDMFFLSFTESLMTYSLGRRIEYFDMPAIRKIIRDAAKDGNRFSAFILGVIDSPAFRMAVAEPAEASDAPPETAEKNRTVRLRPASGSIVLPRLPHPATPNTRGRGPVRAGRSLEGRRKTRLKRRDFRPSRL